MFDLPDAKRVRRSDLYTRSQSASPAQSEPDPELEAHFRARLASLYGPASNSIPVSIPASSAELVDLNAEDEEAEEEVEQEFEFRLFSTTVPGKVGNGEETRAQKIVIVDDEDDLGDGGFVVRERHRGYYFAEQAHGEKKVAFEGMALSGEEVLSRARRRAWGLEVPWRVRVLKVVNRKESGAVLDAVVSLEEGEGGTKKKRPGKKRRILLRERKISRNKLEKQQKVEKEMKEEAEREKRTRRNREKKVKRKLKEKTKKARVVENAGSGGIDLDLPIVSAAGQTSDQ